MANLIADTIKSLKRSHALSQALQGGSNGIYHLTIPFVGKTPTVQFSTVSDVPAMSADNVEIYRSVTIRFHILTKRGEAEYNPIVREMNRIMAEIGWSRVQTTEIYEDGLVIKIVDYRIGVEAE
ncbi:hypothetical protein [Selenomonas ruminantium]|uniref:hypothetical protein n=1 Tax=Selenomonas ruminantium TaxID=971 RepID=UPI0005A53C7E|nr:hypothetical protein [Selenomonas ruminantium]